MSEPSKTRQGHAEIVPFHQPEQEDRPVMLVQERHESSDYGAVFALDLAGVVFDKNGNERHKGNGDKPPRVFESVINTMAPESWTEFVYTGARRRPFTWRVFGYTGGADSDEALTNAQRLYDSLALGMHAEGADFRFAPARDTKVFQRSTDDMVWRARISPSTLSFDTSPAKGMGFRLPSAETTTNHNLLLLPRLHLAPRLWFNRLPLVLRQSNVPVEIRCRATRVSLSDESLKKVGIGLEWLQNGRSKRVKLHEDVDVAVINEALIEETGRLLAAWFHTKSGTRFSVEVLSTEPVPSSLLGVVIDDLMQGQSAEVQILAEPSLNRTTPQPATSGLDLHDCVPTGYPLPPVFPDATLLHQMDTQRIYNRRLSRLPGKGILLGNVLEGTYREDVRFNNRDRSRHVYLIGATGTGKSTLLTNMVLQDIENREGVTVIDPHGDLYAHILAGIPSRREKDLILIDPSDGHFSVGINLLECPGSNRNAEMHFAINEMMKIFYRLYDRGMMGPMFETYMRTAMLTLMDQDPPSEMTLLDIPRFFQDSDFRKRMKSQCKNAMAVEFWTQTAERCTGDQSLPNFTAYVTSKLNTFVYNRLMRNIVGQAKSTIDFRQAMDSRKIILVNLAKGELGQLDCQFLGMLVIGKLFGAALSRSVQKPQARVPHYLYIDEFQNFTTDTVAYMMGEARKFELRLTLANQNLSQLDHHQDHSEMNITEAVLGNVGTFLCFRAGTPDAEKLEDYTKPEFDSQDLQYLPDYHVIAKLLANNVPTRPFVFQTMPSPERKPSKTLLQAIARSKSRYALPVDEVEKNFSAQEDAPKEPSRSRMGF